MNRYSGRAIIVICLVILFHLQLLQIVSAQAGGTPVECGTILEAEFTPNNASHSYTIQFAAGDTLRVRAEPIGDVLNLDIGLYDPSSDRITYIFRAGRGNPVEGSIELSASGTYTINTLAYNSIGAYTLSVGCTLRDGTVINPGDLLTETSSPSVSGSVGGSSSSSEVPAFSGVGFLGLAPVDFTNAFLTSLDLGEPEEGQIPAEGNAVYGYTFDGNVGDVIELEITTQSSNPNLGLVVLSADNQVVFQASLVTSQTLSTRFTLPSGGQYTIGVFRIDLLPPAAPEATAFQLQATLNP